MKLIYSPKYEVNIGAHPFPTEKYRLVREQLLKDGVVHEDDFEEPIPPEFDDLLEVHEESYIRKLKEGTLTPDEQKKLELPYSPEMAEAAFLAASGTYQACFRAMQTGIAVHLGGGFHHAYPDHGEGFCPVNDLAFAIRLMIREGHIERAAIIDCDLHQGNGTAVMFQYDPGVFTFSIHQENNYPHPKEKSSWDIGLPDAAVDEEYFYQISQSLPKILTEFEPDLVLYDAGADPYEGDKLGGLAITMEGLRIRDRFILESCVRGGYPVAAVLGGGYAHKLEDTVKIHANTVREALLLDIGLG